MDDLAWSQRGEARRHLLDLARGAGRLRAASHQLAIRAYDEGVLAEVVAVPGVELTRDESLRADTSLEKLAELAGAFADDGTVTAGNSSPLNDGASMTLIGDEAAGALLGREPLARVVATAAHGVDPDVFGIAPVEAVNKALARAGIGWGEVVCVELNEAFASQSLACLAGWPTLTRSSSTSAAARSLSGNPLGASGTRVSAASRTSCARGAVATV